MPVKVLVPLLGEGVQEVTISRWLKKEGESVQELDPLLEVNTDKVDTEIPSPASGVLLKVLVKEGTVAKVGEVIALIGQPGEAIEPAGSAPSAPSEVPVTSAPAPGSAAAPATSAAAPAPEGSRMAGFISPVVARLAAEHGVDLSQVKGTGQGGRITKNDVLAYIEARQRAAATAAPVPPAAAVTPPAPSVPPPAAATPSAPPVPPPAAAPRPIPALQSELIPHTLMRRQIAEHMVMSKHTSPHVLTVMEADMSRVIAHRNAHKEQFARDGVHLTYTAYFIAAVVAALKAYPIVNSSWTDEGLLVHKEINIGMATSLGEEGLIVPVIKHADTLSLLGLARAINDLASRARAKKLQPDEVKGGTFTITNHGISGSLFAFPIINQPQCGILGVGALHKRPIVITDAEGNDSIAIRPMVYLSFVFDHRILDGASADWFLMKVKQTLENWS
jgi:2-oxoglutarate dehydrogenase E2 component (dihydrolipoamide succinyltransferase)